MSKVGEFSKLLETTLFLFSSITVFFMCLNVTSCIAMKLPDLPNVTPFSSTTLPSSTETYNDIKDSNMSEDVSENKVIRQIEC